MSVKHFLDIDQLESTELREIIERAKRLKSEMSGSGPRELHLAQDFCRDAILIMIFDKPSTRTRVSFDVAMRQLGGSALPLNRDDMQLGRGESIADTARVLSRYGDAIMLRTVAHESLLTLAENADIPVINGLTDLSHPCQIMADILTIEEKRGPMAEQTIAWVGDGNNVAVSWIHAAVKFGCRLRLACPEQFSPPAQIMQWAQNAGGAIELMSDPVAAVSGAHCVITDTWVSMGQQDADQRMKIFAPYQVNASLMAHAAKDAIFMHCLPAHREDEVTSDVIDGPQSVVFDEAENRLHAQKAILSWCLER